jgi:hypothetical protein
MHIPRIVQFKINSVVHKLSSNVQNITALLCFSKCFSLQFVQFLMLRGFEKNCVLLHFIMDIRL